MLAVLQDDRVTHIEHNPVAGDYLKACWRGYHLTEETYAPDRLTHPLVRSGPRGSGQFRRASWDEALAITAGRLGEIRAKYGPTAVLSRGSAGVIGAMHATYAVLGRFMNYFGGCTGVTMNYSNAAAGYILPYIFGGDWHSTGFDPVNLLKARMIILWGANVLETRQGAEVPRYLLEAVRRGTQVVVIDPRRSGTAKQTGAWWLPCRPGADAALMLAVLFVLFKENLTDRAFISTHAHGFDQLEAYINSVPCTPAWAAERCGLPAEEIIRFARAYAAARPALLFPGYSIQRVVSGEEPYRLSVALQIATGNLGKSGGSSGSMNNLTPIPRVGTLPGGPVPAENPSVPVLRWPDLVLEGRAGGYPSDIHAIYNVGSNVLNQGSDIRKNVAAFEKVDFAVTHELFLTPTARYCDIVFPVSSSLEKEDIGLPWQGNYLLYKSQVLNPPGEARSDYEILCALADRLGFGAEYSQGRTASQWIESFIEQSEISDPAAFRQSGVYFGAAREYVGLADFSADPTNHPLRTLSGFVEIASEKFARETGYPAVPTWRPDQPDPRYPLRLLTPKSPWRTHSQGSNIPLVRKKARHALEMHPIDAAARGLKDGEQVRLFNPQGEAHVPLRLCDDIMPGVVSLPEGVWVELNAQGIDTAGAGNMLTSTDGTRPGIACVMHGMPVEVTGL
jgi:anaerobic dimethyl sulfoxide reductase subunit A